MFLFLLSTALGSYLPGTKPKIYKQGESIKLFVNKLDSSSTQLPFEYYYLNFCKPASLSQVSENIGETLSGDTIENSPYVINMQEPVYCESLCTVKNSRHDIELFTWMIDNHYRANWILDNLPSGYRVSVTEAAVNYAYYQNGVPIGFISNDRKYVYNHHHIIIKTYQISEDAWSVVGFLVQPLSFNTSSESVCGRFPFRELIENWSEFREQPVASDENMQLIQELTSDSAAQRITPSIEFTYSVSFEASDTSWTSRWEVYLYSKGGEVHWLSILNSFGMVIFLSVMVAHLFRRTISRDISHYNESVDLDPEVDSGWKQLRGDVFRPPTHYGLFSILFGAGVQLILMVLFTIIFACVGFSSPQNRGALLTSTLFLFAFMGCFGGFAASRIYKMFGGLEWKTNAIGVAFLFPGFCFSVFFCVNFLIWEEESSGAVDFYSLLELILIWFGISVPLVFIGSAVGYKKLPIINPCRVSKIPKPIPTQNYKIVYFVCMLAGSLPFGCMFIELNYIMNSLWHHNLFYYLFGFLFLCFIVLVITSAEVSILMSYIILCREDYRWWWLSLSVSGSSGGYLFLYSIFYFFLKLEISHPSSIILYFSYMMLGSLMYSLVTGSIGFISTFLFVRKIYSLIKSE